MILSCSKLCDAIRHGNESRQDGIAVVPAPELDVIKRNGEASVSLRLGRWFVTMRQSSETHIRTIFGSATPENRISKRHFVPFGEAFILHPGRFALASTLEWIKLPNKYAAYVVGKSMFGRRGIIVEAAAGVHPGFSGCLTLEIANVGEVPVELVAGQTICQLFFHSLEGELSTAKSLLAGQRKPRLGQIKEDPVMTKLVKSKR